MKQNSRIIVCLLLIVSSLQGFAQKDTTKLHLGPLFKKDSMLQLTMVTNLKTLMKDRGEKPITHWAMLQYEGKKKPVSLKIKIKVRGNFRKSPVNCVFPPILLDIPSKKDKNTIFERQNRLKLVTHCQNEEYIFQEYLVYKAYNLLTDYSFKARLAKVTYKDSSGKREPQTRYAFILEDERYLAKRNRVENFNLKNIRMQKIDSVSMATVAVFEYLIGNTDWSVPFLHNIKLLGQKNGNLLAVPYDFDHSGIVEAKYANPPEILELSSVRERLYRGITYTPAVFKLVFDKFRSIKPQLYALYQDNPNLNTGYIKRTIKYLDEFYETIDNPKSLQKIFITGGGKGQDVVIKGLK